MVKYCILCGGNATTKKCSPITLNYCYRLRPDSVKSGRNIGLLTFWMNLLPLHSVCYPEDQYRIPQKGWYIFCKTIRTRVLRHNNLHIMVVVSSKLTYIRLNFNYFDLLNFNFFFDVKTFILVCTSHWDTDELNS